MRVGLIGAGWIAQEHLANLARFDDVDVVAVCDLDEGRAREAAERAGAEVAADWQELLGGDRVDAVFVCTPPLAHREPAVAALRRGLHVYLEKPIARTEEDAREIVAAAEASDAVCAVGYQWHAVEVLEDLRAALEGQTVALTIGRSVGPTQARPWFLDRTRGGGNVLERGSHHIDLARAVGGEVASVQAAASEVPLAQGVGERGDIEDAAALLLHYESGGLGAIQVAWTRSDLPGFYSLDVVATESTFQLTLDPDFLLRGRSRGLDVEARAKVHPLQRSVERFLEAARAGDRELVFCTPRDAERTLAVAVACEQALATGEVVGVQSAR